MPKAPYTYILFNVFFVMLLLSAFSSNGQVYNSRTGVNNNQSILDNTQIISDSAKGFAEKDLDHSVDIFYRNEDGKRYEVDTSISDVHRHAFLNEWEVSLGNIGAAYQSLKARANLPPQFDLLPARWDAYRYNQNDLKFYNTTKPFSMVRYVAGSKQEQVLELFHTQNISPLWNFSTAYRKINSLGFYNVQKNNIDNFKFTTGYKSPNQRYTARGAFVYNKLQQDENLGLVKDSFLAEPDFSNHIIIPVGVNVASSIVRSPILNYRRDANVRFIQDYSIGNTTVTYDEDSIKQTTFKPVLTFANEIYYAAERYCFLHGEADSTFQSVYLNENFSFEDTLNLRYNNNTVGTNISAEGNVYIKDKVFSVLAGVGFEYQKIGGWEAEQKTINNYVFGELTNRKSKDSSWKLDADVKLYYTGAAKGNLNFNGKLSKMLPKNIGEVGVVLGQYIQQPFYIAESIQVNGVERTRNLKSQINTTLGGYYKNEKLKFKAQFNSLLFNNLIYSDGLEPNYKNYSDAISIQQLQLEKGLAFGKWTSVNKILLQITVKNTPINIPLLSTNHRLAYNDYIFKGKLEISTGLDVYFNTPYYNNMYQPIFQSFNPQYSRKFQMIPRMNPFFNFKIKRFRASVSLDQMQHFLVKNNLNYVSYAAQNQMFRFGLRWIFIN